MKRFWMVGCLLAGALAAGPGYCLPPLQMFIEITPPGAELRLPPGTYSGPAVINRPLIFDGEGKITIDARGEGTVLTVKADGVVVRGLRLTNSGRSHDGVDAGLLVEANDVVIEGNVVDDSLFGIHLKGANNATIRGNHISSKSGNRDLRGDGIRLWFSHENLIEGNQISNVRDLYFTNSSDNRIIGNDVSGSRIGMEFVFGEGNLVEDNTLRENKTGIVVIYSNDLTIRRNRISHAREAAGSALALKESQGVVIEENDILHCAVGVLANSPNDPDYGVRFVGNRLAYNDIGMYFYGERGGHVIHDNRFEQNLLQVAVSAPTSARSHDWLGNYWDDYEGFDRDGDGVGDLPHEIHLYSDRIWLDRPMARFFRGSPVLETLDFLERLAPFSQPPLVLRDPAPRAHGPVRDR